MQEFNLLYHIQVYSELLSTGQLQINKRGSSDVENAAKCHVLYSFA